MLFEAAGVKAVRKKALYFLPNQGAGNADKRERKKTAAEKAKK